MGISNLIHAYADYGGDSYGIIYYNGTPIRNVPFDAKYSTPFAYARASYVRPTLTDEWKVNDVLTINNRLSFLHRSLEFFGNGDSSKTKVVGNEVGNRQLRQQNDSDNTLDYQLEPVWKFATGCVKHTLLTGFEYQHQTINTDRSTAESYLTNFNSENTQTGIGAPESAQQYEVGVKFSFLDGQYVLNTALFDVSRDNVATPTTVNNIETVVYDSQRTQGGEASLDAAIMDNLHVIANFTAQHAYITSNLEGITAVGHRPQDVPAFMANV